MGVRAEDIHREAEKIWDAMIPCKWLVCRVLSPLLYLSLEEHRGFAAYKPPEVFYF